MGAWAASHTCSYVSCRRCLYHNRDLRVESVGHHRGQLSAALRPEVLEAKAVPSQLLQAHVLAHWGTGSSSLGSLQGCREVGGTGALEERQSGCDRAPPIRAGGHIPFLFFFCFST